MTLSLESLRREGDEFHQTISRELYASGSGLKKTAELQAIYARFANVLSDDALAMVREMFRDAPAGSEEQRSARILLEWQADARVSRELAELDEREIAWESSAIARVDDGRGIQYQQMAIEIANAANRDERLRLESARASLVANELAPMRAERFQREKDIVEALEIAGSYNDTFTALSGVNLPSLVDECKTFLRDTQAMWDDVFAEVVRRDLDIDPREATRADALALMRAPAFDPYFPSKPMEAEVRRQLSDMGADATANGCIIFDTGEREGKSSRAFCSPVRVPQEVYLVLRPHGGQTDYRTFLHELGHALHFANTRADFPFEYRWLGDNSITESYAMLFDHMLHLPGWLARYTELGAPRIPTFLRAAGFEELQFLRRYAAKLIYEHELYGGGHSWESLPDVYVETLSRATSFRYDRADAFVDVDPRYYAARYLRAWQLQAVIGESLVERFDEDWYRNPRAGPYIIETMFAEGQRELAHELAERVTARALSFAPLVRATESMLVSA
jgi:hypothetical protein